MTKPVMLLTAFLSNTCTIIIYSDQIKLGSWKMRLVKVECIHELIVLFWTKATGILVIEDQTK